MSGGRCADPVILNEWHAVAALEELPVGRLQTALLLGERLVLERGSDGAARARIAATGAQLPVRQRFGYLWTSLGAPTRDLFAIAEPAEPDRRNLHAASIGVAVSAPRAIENFLDLSHFPFVHTGYLGDEPMTEVKSYDVRRSADGTELVATRCRFFQPRAAANAEGGFEVEYVYRVPHPYCSVLYKINSVDRERMDVIALFAQPLGEERIRAHMFLSMLDETSSDAALRHFQLLIFGQDKPILENQVPKKLPLATDAELAARADLTSVVYRRWLAERGVTYGTIPPARGAPSPRAA
ncbi:MAG: aromatic ring-hydroxylating dioxygenase subunit alpha [Alphaproteobacteria bacterium]|nr:aromatic ring-hydroxylating dioxygenase subunit alpha [Alphaproteobacteria bacterium]